MADIAAEIGIGRSEPVEWQEIRAYTEATGVELTAGEARTIRAMATAYARESAEAKDFNAPAPYMPAIEATEEDRKELARRMRAATAKRR